MGDSSDVLNRDFDDIGVQLDGHVALVEIQRPPHNFFDYALIEQLADAFSGLDEIPTAGRSSLLLTARTSAPARISDPAMTATTVSARMVSARPPVSLP